MNHEQAVSSARSQAEKERLEAHFAALQSGMAESFAKLQEKHHADTARQLEETRNGLNSLRESGEVTELRWKALNERLANMHEALQKELDHVTDRHTKLATDLAVQAERADHASSEVS